MQGAQEQYGMRVRYGTSENHSRDLITVVRDALGARGETHVDMYTRTVRYAHGTLYPPPREAQTCGGDQKSDFLKR